MDTRLAEVRSAVEAAAIEKPATEEPHPPPLPPSAVSFERKDERGCDLPPEASLAAPVPTAPPPSAPSLPIQPLPMPPPPPRESLEIQLGSVWLARIGIVILITGLVFLGNYAYHTFVGKLGAGGKLALLYLAGGALAGLGARLERGRAQMRNYARVLMAGGAATIYYATYAAHYVPGLRIIQSPLVAGVLLLLLAGGLIWWAERRRSETFAILTLLFSYYTAAINTIGSFTLFSSLLLTGTAVYFLLRRQWAAISWAALLGTYGSYGFWQWRQASLVEQWGLPESPAALHVAFLALCWAVFTGGVFFASAVALPATRRTAFLSLNNAALLYFCAQQIGWKRESWFWLFALVFGGVLLALAATIAWRRSPATADSAEKAAVASTEAAWLAQGLAVFTLGLATKLGGETLALTLAVESAVLLTGANTRHGLLFKIAAGLTALWAATLTLGRIYEADSLFPGLPVAAFLLFDAWWLKRRSGQESLAPLQAGAAAFATLGLVVGGFVIVDLAPSVHQPWIFAAAALACTASVYVLRTPEIALPAQFYVAAAILVWIVARTRGIEHPWWCVLPVVGCALALGHWWQRQKLFEMREPDRTALEFVGMGAAIVALGILIHEWTSADGWMAFTALGAIVSLAYGLLTRSWVVAVCGQILLLLSIFAQLRAIVLGHPAWYMSLPTVVACGLSGALILQLPRRALPDRASPLDVAPIARAYRIAAYLLLAVWAVEYIPAQWLICFFAAGGAASVIVAALTENRERAWAGVAFLALAVIIFSVRFWIAPSLPDLLAVLLMPGGVRVARLLQRPEQPVVSGLVQTIFSAAGTFTIWLWTTRWIVSHRHLEHLTVAWSATALIVFAAGLLLKERVYRVGGFIILALAVGRMAFVDIWRLDLLPRILSLLVLGAVLLVLGFVYNKYADKIRKWL